MGKGSRGRPPPQGGDNFRRESPGRGKWGKGGELWNSTWHPYSRAGGKDMNLGSGRLCSVILQNTTPPLSLLSWKKAPMSTSLLEFWIHPHARYMFYCSTLASLPSPNILPTCRHASGLCWLTDTCHPSAAFCSSLFSNAPAEFPGSHQTSHNLSICFLMHALQVFTNLELIAYISL